MQALHEIKEYPKVLDLDIQQMQEAANATMALQCIKHGWVHKLKNQKDAALVHGRHSGTPPIKNDCLIRIVKNRYFCTCRVFHL